jgi:uncharacterized protein YndB with AHSA1/START domain
MNDLATASAYGELIEPTTLKIQRLLPGPVERVWAYLTQSELRRKWLASGDMQPKAGSEFELTWRNDELTNPPGKRPEGFGTEHSMTSRIIAFDPPRKLAYTFGVHGEVSFDLQPAGQRVLLTLIHRRLPDRNTMLKVSAGWHAHLDILVARASGAEPAPFWDAWLRLKGDYDKRLPA